MTEEQVVITNLLPVSYQAMISGRFDEALDVLLNDPQELSRFLKALDYAVSKNKSHALEIKDRNFFERMFAKNSKDLADVAYEQNVVMSAFYLILRLQNNKTEASQKLLSQLYTYADNEAKTTGKEQNNIQKLILNVLNQNAYDYHMDEVRDKALMKLLRAAEYQHQFEDEMREEINKKQDTISDLSIIRSDSQKGATALQPTDIADWAKAAQKPEYKASEIKDLNIPTKTSQLNNDCGFLTEHQDISGKVNISYVEEQLQHTKNDISREVSVLQQSLQIAQDDLQREQQEYTKLKKAFIATSICTGTISLGALVALLILIL